MEALNQPFCLAPQRSLVHLGLPIKGARNDGLWCCMRCKHTDGVSITTEHISTHPSSQSSAMTYICRTVTFVLR